MTHTHPYLVSFLFIPSLYLPLFNSKNFSFSSIYIDIESDFIFIYIIMVIIICVLCIMTYECYVRVQSEHARVECVQLARNMPFELWFGGGKTKEPVECVCVSARRVWTRVATVMSLQARTREVFQELELGRLPEEWVTRCWEDDFCNSSPLPTQVRLSWFFFYVNVSGTLTG